MVEGQKSQSKAQNPRKLQIPSDKERRWRARGRGVRVPGLDHAVRHVFLFSLSRFSLFTYGFRVSRVSTVCQHPVSFAPLRHCAFALKIPRPGVFNANHWRPNRGRPGGRGSRRRRRWNGRNNRGRFGAGPAAHRPGATADPVRFYRIPKREGGPTMVGRRPCWRARPTGWKPIRPFQASELLTSPGIKLNPLGGK
jgi:hypothetical protein